MSEQLPDVLHLCAVTLRGVEQSAAADSRSGNEMLRAHADAANVRPDGWGG